VRIGHHKPAQHLRLPQPPPLRSIAQSQLHRCAVAWAHWVASAQQRLSCAPTDAQSLPTDRLTIAVYSRVAERCSQGCAWHGKARQGCTSSEKMCTIILPQSTHRALCIQSTGAFVLSRSTRGVGVCRAGTGRQLLHCAMATAAVTANARASNRRNRAPPLVAAAARLAARNGNWDHICNVNHPIPRSAVRHTRLPSHTTHRTISHWHSSLT
jgi:hypothetical protein